MSVYVKTLKGYKTEFIDDLFQYIDYEKDQTVEYPEEQMQILIKKSAHLVFVSNVIEMEYKGIYSGMVIKTDENNSVECLASVYFSRERCKTMDDRFRYHLEKILYIRPSDAFTNKEECVKAVYAKLVDEHEHNMQAQSKPPQTKQDTPPKPSSTAPQKFEFDRKRIIKNAWTSFKVGYAILRQENLPDNVLAALYELNSLRKRYRRMKAEKLKEIVAAKHGISVEELGSALQSRINYMKHAKHAFNKIWGTE